MILKSQIAQIEIAHLAADPEAELQEFQQIYIERGLTPALALQVALEDASQRSARSTSS
jgi:VIT1/CCC1 family predicted Fe2+/Mn2+ transporter